MNHLTPNISVSNPVPGETIIYYAKDDAVFKATGASLFLSLGIYFVCVNSYLIGIPLFLFAAYQLYLKIKILSNSRPQIIINLYGMQTAKVPFYKWDQIFEAKVSGSYAGKGTRPCLEYHYLNGKVKLRVDHLNISPQNLSTLLVYYQQPWEFRSNR